MTHNSKSQTEITSTLQAVEWSQQYHKKQVTRLKRKLTYLEKRMAKLRRAIELAKKEVINANLRTGPKL